MRGFLLYVCLDFTSFVRTSLQVHPSYHSCLLMAEAAVVCIWCIPEIIPSHQCLLILCSLCDISGSLDRVNIYLSLDWVCTHCTTFVMFPTVHHLLRSVLKHLPIPYNNHNVLQCEALSLCHSYNPFPSLLFGCWWSQCWLLKFILLSNYFWV